MLFDEQNTAQPLNVLFPLSNQCRKQGQNTLHHFCHASWNIFLISSAFSSCRLSLWWERTWSCLWAVGWQISASVVFLSHSVSLCFPQVHLKPFSREFTSYKTALFSCEVTTSSPWLQQGLVKGSVRFTSRGIASLVQQMVCNDRHAGFVTQIGKTLFRCSLVVFLCKLLNGLKIKPNTPCGALLLGT